MIYDCFTFFNELELLEMRLHELADVVDKFVLVEATRTFMNQPKPLYFQDNRARFADFGDKIVHIIVRDLPNVSNPWVVEYFQRNCIVRGLTDCRPDDWVLVSDVDEIPRATVVQKMTHETPFADNFFSNTVHGVLNAKLSQKIIQHKAFPRLWRKNHPFVWKLQQTYYKYFLNCRSSVVWYGTRMVRFRDFSCANEIRLSGGPRIPAAGWHFTSMGGAGRLHQKLAAYSHQRNDPRFTQVEYLQRAINLEEPLLGEPSDERFEIVPLDASFPLYLREHRDKFSNLLRD